MFVVFYLISLFSGECEERLSDVLNIAYAQTVCAKV